MLDNNIGTARRAFAKRSDTSFTQEDAARYFGVSIGTYRNWEQGRTEPSGAQISRMAEKYGTTVDYLLGVTDSAPATITTNDEQRALNLLRALSAEDKRLALRLLERLAM